MAKSKTSNNRTIWRFRREITLGTLLHLVAIIVMITAAWSNLQKELALIRHELTRLTTTNIKLQENIEKLAGQYQEHEYRLYSLEKIRVATTVQSKLNIK